MSESALFEVAGIVILGVCAQWFAARVGLPSILLLLILGFVAGPFLGLINPDRRFGELLVPFVFISVALVLYEAGLTFRLSEFGPTGRIVLALCTIGTLLTWGVASLGAAWIFDLDRRLAALLGATLVATGPTVVGSLLRRIRPTGRVGSILKYEGLALDPLAAMLAVLVFEVVSTTGGTGATTPHVALSVARTVAVGGGFGVLAAYFLAVCLQRHWVPDFLQNPVSLTLVIAVYAGANAVQRAAGLPAVVVMGIVLANQRVADIRHIVELKENLRALLVSALFIVLAARLRMEDLTRVGWGGLVFVLLLVIVARPLAVGAATLRSGLTIRERLFLAWMAPRGIGVAAIAALLALRLEAAGHGDARFVATIAFATIIGTIVIYSLTAPLVARRLGVAEARPQGVLLVGAPAWTRALAVALRDLGYAVLLVDNNRYHAAAARAQGLPTYSGSILAEYALDEIDLGGLGCVLAVTPNDTVNALAVQRFTRIFGSAECYQLPPRADAHGKHNAQRRLQGRWLFAESCTSTQLSRRFGEGHTIKAIPLSEAFDFSAFRSTYGETAIPMFAVTEPGRLKVISADEAMPPRPGQTLIALVREQPAPPPAT